jgi:hypothetical protein
MYKQFVLEDRIKIEALVKQGFEYHEIAKAMGRNRASISAEIERNGGFEKYSAQKAQSAVAERRKTARDKARLTAQGEGSNPFGRQAIPALNECPLGSGCTNLQSRVEKLLARVGRLLDKIDKREAADDPSAQLLF